jgi:hypothetical protein
VSRLARRRTDGFFALTGRQQLLLRAALGPDDRSVAAFRAWKVSLDMERIDLASQRFVPRLVANLERLGAGADDPVLDQFRKVTRFTWLKTRFLMANCEPLVTALGEAGIPTMLLKGAAVVHHSGGDVSLRPMDDLDLAVPFALARPAIEVVAQSGFVFEGPTRSPEEFDAWVARLHALGARNEVQAMVDLHWHVLPDQLHPRADDEFWQAAGPAWLGRTACRATSREDTIVHAVAHAARPQSDPSLRWAADVAALVESGAAHPVDWDRVVAQSRRSRIALQMGQALDVLRQVADVAIPAEVPEALGRTRVPLAERVSACPRRRRDGRPRLPSRTEVLADAYQHFVGREVAPGKRPSAVVVLRFLCQWWDLPSARFVPAHALFVLAGRPWSWGRRVPGFRPGTPAHAFDGGVVRFTLGGGGTQYLGTDWSFPEDHGTWTTGSEAVIRMKMVGDQPTAGPLVLRCVVTPFLHARRPHLRVDVVVNCVRSARWTFTGPAGQPQDLGVAVDAPLLESDELEIRFIVHRPLTPSSVGVGSDARPVGLYLHTLELERPGHAEACAPTSH